MLHSFDYLSLPQWLSEEDDFVYPRAGRFAVDRPAAAERIRAWALAEVQTDRAHRWPYLVRHLASHLTAEERPGVIAGRLGEFPWLEARLRLAGINGLLGDFALAAPSPDLERLAWPPAAGLPAPGAALGWWPGGRTPAGPGEALAPPGWRRGPPPAPAWWPMMLSCARYRWAAASTPW